MSYVPRWLASGAAIVILAVAADASHAVSLEFAGSQMDVGGTFYSNGATPPCCVATWRSDSDANTFAVSDQVPNRYYGTAGYALFATLFSYPDENLGYSGNVTDPIFADNDLYIDKLALPSFVTNSQILSTRKAGGWAYSLIDDPDLQHGYRHWTFDGVNYPPAVGPCPGPNCNVTGGIPYVKLGLLDGSDLLGNDPATTPTARWGFEVGADTPAKFRVGVMTDGLDDVSYAAAEVFLTHAVGNVPDVTISSGPIARNRFLDIHFFDISGTQAGDQFVFSAMKGAGDFPWASAGISGFTFDVIPDVAVPGDYNNDGSVNAADYTVWRNHLGQTFQLDNEGDNQTPGEVTPEDYDFWKLQFGVDAGDGAASIAVPEPTAAGLLIVAAALGTLARRRRPAVR
jgi:hypothetical protein